jgi:O-antigen/teichoic acid export membrane protein
MKFWGSPLSKRLLKEMLWFGVPLLIAGLAGITNETIDRIMLKTMLFDTLGEKDTMSQLGIYGANYKISIIITLFIQAFRYAAEPFFFSQEKNKNAKETYAKVMNYFVAVVAIIFLGVMYYLELIKYFIPNSEFWGGLAIVPILLFANIFLGIYYNQSIWYKLTNKTKYGAYIAIIGALITVVANYILIPKYGYVGSAWATLVCYFIMVFISYLWGNKHYPVKYNLIRIFGYLTLAVVLWQLALILGLQNDVTGYLVKTVLLLCFAGTIIKIENPFKNGKQAIN